MTQVAGHRPSRTGLRIACILPKSDENISEENKLDSLGDYIHHER